VIQYDLGVLSPCSQTRSLPLEIGPLFFDIRGSAVVRSPFESSKSFPNFVVSVIVVDKVFAVVDGALVSRWTSLLWENKYDIVGLLVSFSLGLPATER